MLLTPTRHGKGGASGWLSIPLDFLWDILPCFCTVFKFFLLLHDQRPKLLIRTSKGSLYHCPVSVLNDNYRTMIITVQLPFGVPGAGTNGQLHPLASKKERDCWTVERGEIEERRWGTHGEQAENGIILWRACFISSVPLEIWITIM